MKCSQILQLVGDTEVGQELIQLACRKITLFLHRFYFLVDRVVVLVLKTRYSSSRKGPKGREVGHFLGSRYVVHDQYEEQIVGRLIYDPGLHAANISKKSGQVPCHLYLFKHVCCTALMSG